MSKQIGNAVAEWMIGSAICRDGTSLELTIPSEGHSSKIHLDKAQAIEFINGCRLILLQIEGELGLLDDLADQFGRHESVNAQTLD